MKRRELIRHLEENGCQELREGCKHTMCEPPPEEGFRSAPPR